VWKIVEKTVYAGLPRFMSVDKTVQSVDNTVRANGQYRINRESGCDVEGAAEADRRFSDEVEVKKNPVFSAYHVKSECYRM